MEYYTVRDGYDCLLGEYDSRDAAISEADGFTNATVYAFDIVAVYSTSK